MRSLSRSATWQAIAIASTLVIGGVALMATQSNVRPSVYYYAGAAILLGGLVLLLIAVPLRRLRAKRSRAALEALGHLVGRGDVAWRGWNERQADAEARIEDWRREVGDRLRLQPFVPGAADWVLTQHGNRLDDPLDRLRTMQGDVERWIE